MANWNLKAVLSFDDKSKRGVDQAKKGLGSLQGVVKAAGAAMVAFGAQQVASAAYELAELGAQSLRTKDSFEAISGSAGNARLNLDAMRRATRGAMSEMEMMQSANQLMQMGLARNSTELEKLTTMATRLGAAMGRDATESMESFSLMLANMSIPRLDTFGISAGKVRTRIRMLQAATPGMTREMAFMTAVMEEGEDAMGRLGEATEDAALQFERTEARIADAKAELGERAAPIVADFLETTLNLGDILSQVGVVMLEMAQGPTRIWSDEIDILQLKMAGLWDQTGRTGRTIERDLNLMLQRTTSEVIPPAIEAVYGLGEAAREMGSKFAAGVPTAEDMFMRLMGTERVAGMTATQIGELATAMGVADSSTVSAVIEAERLVTAFENGQVSVEDMATHAGLLEDANKDLTLAEEAEREGNMELADQYRKSARELIRQANKVRAIRLEYERLLDIGPAVQGFLRGQPIPATPAGPVLESVYGGGGAQYQYGGVSRGGMAIVGEMGPELVALPRGARVMSAGDTRYIRQRTINRGGDTIHVRDTAALLALEEMRYRQEMRGIEEPY